MEIPSSEQFSRIFGHVERIDELPASQISAAIAKLDDDGEPEEILSYLRLNYTLPSPPEFELKPGDRIADHYTIKDKIGAGGMGIVYRATQDRTERDVALKLIHPRLHTPALLERFKKEIVTLGKLDHPGIVHLFDADTHDGTIFFAMQLLDGDPLHRYLRKNVLTRHQQLDLIISLCDAVQAAHDRGIIHRDLKPGNIYIDRSTGKPIVLDFGLATLAGQLIASEEQQISGLSGSPNYMSPEQFLGTAGEFGVGQSIDVYALGVIAFEVLAGRSPYEFPHNCSWATKRSIVLEASPSHLADHPELDEAVRQAIRKNPADRYFTAAGFAQALRRIQHVIDSPADLRSPAWRPREGAIIPSTEWLLEKEISEVGTGQVWLARHRKRGEKREFKFCEDPEKIGEHPNIARLHDVSPDDPPYFVAMDHIAGRDLVTNAYRRGIVRAASIAAVIIGCVAGLGFLTSVQNQKEKRSSATASRRDAFSIADFGTRAGRRAEGLSSLKKAVLLNNAAIQIRSTIGALLPKDEIWKTAAAEHKGMESVSSLADNHHQPQTITRNAFPWIPIPKAGLPALAGPATSMQALLADAQQGNIDSYRYAEDNLTCFCWHPNGMAIASGHANATIDIWDLDKGVKMRIRSEESEAERAPKLDILPVVDQPPIPLTWHRGIVDGKSTSRWGDRFASIDSAGKIVSNYSDGAEIRAGYRPSPTYNERRIALRTHSVAWRGDSRTLFAITPRGIHWLAANDLESLALGGGDIPESVGWLTGTSAWAIPTDDKSITYPDPKAFSKNPEASGRWSPVPATGGSDALLHPVTDPAGRAAVHFVQQVQFSEQGKPPNQQNSFNLADRNLLCDKLLCDKNGRALSALLRGVGKGASNIVSSQNSTSLIGRVADQHHATFKPPRSARIASITWSPGPGHPAITNEDTSIQIGFLPPWRDWIKTTLPS